MPQKNVVLFVILSGLTLIGLNLLQRALWPPQPPHHVVKLPEARLWGALPAQVGAAIGQLPAAPGMGAPGSVAAQILLAEWSAGLPPVLATKRKEPAPPTERAVAKKPVPIVPRAPHLENITLGDDGRFNLRVSLTTLGAGVQQVVLNRFQEADAEGRAVWKDKQQREKQPLALVPNDPLHPSDVLYHYADPGETRSELPLDVLGKMDWTLKSRKTGPADDEHEVSFVTQIPGQDIIITKTFRLVPGEYHVALTLTFERKPGSGGSVKFRYQLSGAHGLPVEGQWYTTVWRNAVVGRIDAGGTASRDLETGSDVGVHRGGEEYRGDEKAIQYAGVVTQYFASVLVVSDKQVKGVDARRLLAWARPTLPTLESEPDLKKPQSADITVRAIAEPLELKPGERVTHEYLLYNGPVKVRLLGQLEEEKTGPGGAQPQRAKVASSLVDYYESTLHLNTMTDHIRFGIWSRVIIWCTNQMHWLLEFLHNWVIPWSYGLCIILLTMLVRGMMFPLSRKQAIAGAKMQARMQELQPDIKKLEERFKGDAMGLHQAKNELMLKRGIHPLTMMGSCWVAFLQMPIFLGLYYALQESIYFRLAPFLWIDNLAAPDMLVRWGEIPILSGFLGPYLNVLPLVAVALMIVQQKMLAPPPTDEQQAMQQKTMQYMMIFFGFMFYKVAAGLCLYFIASSLWGVTERKLLPKPKPLSVPSKAPTNVPSRPRPGRRASENGDGKMRKVRDFWDKILKEARKK